MNDCKVCLGNDTKIEDKVQRYPKATQPRGSMLSSAQLIETSIGLLYMPSSGPITGVLTFSTTGVGFGSLHDVRNKAARIVVIQVIKDIFFIMKYLIVIIYRNREH